MAGGRSQSPNMIFIITDLRATAPPDSGSIQLSIWFAERDFIHS